MTTYMYPQKLLSIIVPSYNMQAYLPSCLGSLIVDDNELLSKLNVIVVNDGSKDCTSKIAHEFEEKYPGVFHVIDKENGHYGSCINVGLKFVRGAFVKVLDADDAIDTEGLSRFLRFLEVTDADLVLSDWVDVTSEGKVERQIHHLPTSEVLTMNQYLWKYPIAFHAGITYKADVFNRFDYLQLEGVAYTDLEWDVLPFTVVNSVAYVPEIVYRYTTNRDGQTSGLYTQCRNYQMILTMFLDLTRKYEIQRLSTPYKVQEFLDWFISFKIAECYRRIYVNRAQGDIFAFDDALKKVSSLIYNKVSEHRLGRLRVNFALLHRRHSLWGRLCIVIYSCLFRLIGR